MPAKRARMSDAGVSPVVGTILMVAITVVLAASVYVWMSSMGTRGERPAGTVALVSDGALDAPGGNNPQKAYVISAATPGMRWSDLSFKLDGTAATYVATLRSANAPNLDAWCVLDGAGACEASAAAAGLVEAGDRLMLEDAALGSAKLLVVDPASNSILYSLTVQ